jgi:transposase
MKLSELISIAGSEKRSEEFLGFCGGKSMSRVRRKFFKCYGCRREWSVRKDSILD